MTYVFPEVSGGGSQAQAQLSAHRSPQAAGQATSVVEEAHLTQRMQHLENRTAVHEETQQSTAEEIAALRAKLERLERQQQKSSGCACLTM